MNIASFIDHTILRPDTTVEEIENLCREAFHYKFAAVCIPPYFINKSKQLLQGSKVRLTTVIGFPFGYNSTESKLKDIEAAIGQGTDELDVVHNVIALKNNDWPYLENEMREMVRLVHGKGKKIKVIIESGKLTNEQLIRCCEEYRKYNIDFLKTSTGFAEQGATVEAVNLMRKHLPSTISIKASGGIRSFEFAMQLINAGATRIGSSSSVRIMEEQGLNT
jgi:deoxyribose-phosphate aldolase